MYASLKWLRELCPFDGSAEDVAVALTARGLTVDSVRTVGGDTQLEIDVPPNRPDCLGHRGLARELSAAFGVSLVAARRSPEGAGSPVSDSISVTIDAKDLCGRFTARIVRDVTIARSPAWLAERLEVCGVRSISNVVDISNLVMLETGNPIHFFDLPTVSAARIEVRRATPGERLITLDGQERVLDENMLLVADGKEGVALAGVMGGATTEIGDSTRDVLVEAAWFLPDSIRRTARKTGLATDASHRFERGVDREGVLAAQAMAVELLIELAGGKADTGMVDVYPGRREADSLTLRTSELERLLGFTPDPDSATAALRALGLAPRSTAGATEVTVPTWRVDLTREADLVEEVARHLGYDAIPTTLVGLPDVDTSSRQPDRGEVVRDRLARRGFHEAFGYAMIEPGEDERFVEADLRAPTALTHPIVETMAVLRRSMLPGLLRAVDLNIRRGARDIRLFETGRVFHPRRDDFPLEPLRVGIVWTGAARPPHWSEPTRPVDWFDMVGLIETIVGSAKRLPGATSGHHPGLSAHWETDGRTVAWAGALHPELQDRFDITVWAAEIDLDRLPEPSDRVASYTPLPNLGAVERDIAVVLPPERSWAEVREALLRVKAPVPVGLEAVDRYEGKPLPPGSAAVTVRIRLQPDKTSLTEETIETYRQELIRTLTAGLALEIRG